MALMATVSMQVGAQNNVESGIMLINEDSGATLSEAQLRKCENLMKDAQWYIKRKEFGKAKSKLTELLTINPNDKQAKVLLDQCKDFTSEYGESATQKPTKFTFGLIGGADFGELNFGIHAGFSVKYGHYTDLVNFNSGLEILHLQSYKGRHFEYTRSITLGTLLEIPMMAKFNVMKVKDKASIYAGAGAILEYAILNRKDDSNYITGKKEQKYLNSVSVPGLIQAGISSRYFDVGIYYRHYFTDLVNDYFPSYQEKGRIGFSAAYYF